jgi:putative tryptophan/tyrosine transport system substrate-binding protein
MRRREFIAGIGSVAAWPLVARAQQQRVPVIGFLHSQSQANYNTLSAGFSASLKEQGFVEGQNVAVVYLWADGQFEKLPRLAAELIRQHVDIIATGGGPQPARAAKAVTTTVPIVAALGVEPVSAGLIEHVNRPGGNLTGATLFTQELEGKRLMLLRDLLPQAKTVAYLHPDIGLQPDIGPTTDLEIAARSLGLELMIVNIGTDRNFVATFESIAEGRADALVIAAVPLFVDYRDTIAALATHFKIPTIHESREYVIGGGLMSYGASIIDSYRQAGTYAGKILKGASPRDLPFLFPTKFELVLNLKTAKALGVAVPQSLLAIADEVIE